MNNSIVADSAISASGKDVYAPIRFGISIIHPDGRHVPPMSVSAAAQQEPAVFLTFAEEVSHEAERLKAEQLEIDTVGLLVKLQPQESLKQAMQRGLLTWQSVPFHHNFTPTECRINSADVVQWQVEAGASRLGLTVVVADSVPERHLRLCTVSKG